MARPGGRRRRSRRGPAIEIEDDPAQAEIDRLEGVIGQATGTFAVSAAYQKQQPKWPPPATV